MKTAFISDIHGNITALKAVLKDIESQNADKIFCLGDLISPYNFASEIIDLLLKYDITVIKGNGEDKVLSWIGKGSIENIRELINFKPIQPISDNLTIRDWDFISSLPNRCEISINDSKITLFHATLNSLGDFLYFINGKPNYTELELLTNGTYVVGHNHWARQIKYKSANILYSGSVGLPLKGSHSVSYLLLDHNDLTPIYRFVEYDHNVFLKLLKDSNFIKTGGPMSWIMIDEIVTQEDRLTYLLDRLKKVSVENSYAFWENICRDFLISIGRWEFVYNEFIK
jgi:predicted phosphodiesterase